MFNKHFFKFVFGFLGIVMLGVVSIVAIDAMFPSENGALVGTPSESK